MTRMEKDITYDITECNSRNELADAIEGKNIAIHIGENLKADLYKELKEQIDINHTLGNILDKIGTSGGIIAAICFLVGGGIAAADFMYVLGSKIIGQWMKNNDFEKYVFAILAGSGTDQSEDIFLFRKKDVDGSRYTISGYEQYRFLIKGESECPVCQTKTGKAEKEAKKKGENPFCCPKCGHKLVWVVSPSKAKGKLKKVE